MKKHTWTLVSALAVMLAVTSASAESNRDRADRHHEQAAAYFRVEAYEDAIEEWRKSYELHPNPNRLFNIGRAYEELGNFEAALDFYGRYVESDPDGRAVTEANARIRRLERELETVRAETQRSEAMTTARARMAERDYDAAIAAYHRAYEASEDPEIVYEIAQAHRLAGQVEEAIAEYGRYLEIAIDGARASDALAHQQQLEAELESRPEGEGERRREGDVAPAPASAERDTAPSSSGWSGMRIAGLSSLGVAGISAGASVFFGAAARSAQRAVEDEDVAWSAELDDEVSKGEAAQRNLIIATAVSGVALVAGGALLYLDLRSDAETSRRSVTLSPTFSPSSAGFAVRGRF